MKIKRSLFFAFALLTVTIASASDFSTLEFKHPFTYLLIEKNSYHLSSLTSYHDVVLKNKTLKSQTLYVIVVPSNLKKLPTVTVDRQTASLEKDSRSFFLKIEFPPLSKHTLRIEDALSWSNSLPEKISKSAKTCLTHEHLKNKDNQYSLIDFGKWERQNLILAQYIQIDVDLDENETLDACPLTLKHTEPGLYQYKKKKSYLMTPSVLFIKKPKTSPSS